MKAYATFFLNEGAPARAVPRDTSGGDQPLGWEA